MYPEINLLSISIPTYLLVISAVYCLMIFYFIKRLRSYALPEAIGIDLLLWVMVSGFVGARLFFVVYVEPAYFWAHLDEVLRFWKGGFVFFGGFFLSLVVGILYLGYKKQKLAPWMNVTAPVVALGYGLGRMACFLNGCCYGTHCDLAWAVHFPHLEGWRHPSQIYALLFEVVIWIGLLGFEKKLGMEKLKDVGFLFFAWMLAHGLGRLMMEHFRADPRGPELFGLSISTCISLILVGTGLGLLFGSFIKKARTTH